MKRFDIHWVSAGVGPFRGWKGMHTGNYQVPAIGHTVREKGREYEVINVMWNYDISIVFITVDWKPYEKSKISEKSF